MNKLYEVYQFDKSYMKCLLDRTFEDLSKAKEYIGKKAKESDDMYHLEVVGIEEGV